MARNEISEAEGLAECVSQAIQEYMARCDVNRIWPDVERLSRPQLRLDVSLGDAGKASKKVVTRTLDLTGLVTPASSQVSDLPIGHDGSVPLPATVSEQNVEPGEEPQPQTQNKMDLRKRKADGIGGLRVAQSQHIQEDRESQRQISVPDKAYSKRRKKQHTNPKLQESTFDKFVTGLWEQVHSGVILDPAVFVRLITPQAMTGTTPNLLLAGSSQDHFMSNETDLTSTGDVFSNSFKQFTSFCGKITQASRVCRSFELIVQARWIDAFDEHLASRSLEDRDKVPRIHKKELIAEACRTFKWTDKELHNKMAIWRGYKEIKDTAGWAALVFAGHGIYRFCKYRVGFDAGCIAKFKNLRKRLEVAADTLHPQWRQLLYYIGQPSEVMYHGHPLEWAVFENGRDPVRLSDTYPLDEQGRMRAFEHIDESIIDGNEWGCDDPRWVPQLENGRAMIKHKEDNYRCRVGTCEKLQSDDPAVNECECFPTLFGCAVRQIRAVQVVGDKDGKNNSLQALKEINRGWGIGEYVGLVTKGLRSEDVMGMGEGDRTYQISQKHIGNYTRFVNHSCDPNAEWQTFIWMDTERCILVSKEVKINTEITVDYGDKYWSGLDKECQCGAPKCRYKKRSSIATISSDGQL